MTYLNINHLIKRNLFMKKIVFFLTLVFLLLSCHSEQKKENLNYEIVSGQVKHAPSKRIILQDMQGKKAAELILDDQGVFSDTLFLPKAYYKFNLGNQYTWMYLKPGDNLQISLDYKDFDKSLIYKGKGSEVNNYLAKKMLKRIELRPKTSYRYFAKLDEKDFVKLQDSIYNVYDDLIKDLDNEEFASLEKFRNQTYKAAYLSRFPVVKRYFTHDSSYKVSDQYPDPLADIDVNDKRFMQIPNGLQMIMEFIGVKVSNQHNGKETDPYERLSMIDKEIKDQNLKEILAYKEARYNILYTKKTKEYYQLFDKLVQNDSLKQIVKEKYDRLVILAPGTPSPDFTAYDINGKEYHLKDFAGKALYIDLWATWCGPCVEEVPYLEKLKQQYKGKDITFISLDVYDREDKWKQMIKKKKMGGWQLINTDRNMPFLKKYVVDGIPRFILLDKDGKVVDANAPRPSSGEELTGLIDKTIGK